MTWAAFGSKCKSNVVFASKTLDSKGYTKILGDHLLTFGPKCSGKNWIFQQDNASIHSSRFTKTFLKEKKIQLFDRPSKSSDLNPNENLQGLLVRDVYENGKQYDNVMQLKEAWDKVEKATLQKLSDSVPSRIFEVIFKLGGTTTFQYVSNIRNSCTYVIK